MMVSKAVISMMQKLQQLSVLILVVMDDGLEVMKQVFQSTF